MNSCNHEGCTAQSESHHWGKKKAQSAGWFFQRGGVSWCPEHVPDWVGPWRAKQAAAWDDKGGKGVGGKDASIIALDEPNDIDDSFWDAFSGGAAPDVSTKERHDEAR